MLTKCDVSGPERTAFWKQYLKDTHPDMQVVAVESYSFRSGGEGQGRRKIHEPHIPMRLRDDLVEALKLAHTELCTAPSAVSADPEKLESWNPRVNTRIDWEAVKNAEQKDITHAIPERHYAAGQPADAQSDGQDKGAYVEEFISIGLIGKSSVPGDEI